MEGEYHGGEAKKPEIRGQERERSKGKVPHHSRPLPSLDSGSRIPSPLHCGSIAILDGIPGSAPFHGGQMLICTASTSGKFFTILSASGLPMPVMTQRIRLPKRAPVGESGSSTNSSVP